MAHFNAKKAECYKPEDRQKLLAVIEAAFGDVKEFNKSVREMFDTVMINQSARLSPRGGKSPGARQRSAVHPMDSVEAFEYKESHTP